MEQEELARQVSNTAKHCQLVKRVQFHIDRDERVFYIDCKPDQFNKCLGFALSMILPVTSSFIDAPIPRGLALAISIILVVGFAISWNVLNAICAVAVLIFTDKAIYHVWNSDSITIKQNAVTRIPYTDIKAYAISVKHQLFGRAGTCVKIHRRYDCKVPDVDELLFSAGITTVKRVFESVIHQLHPVSTQQAAYLEKKGAPDAGTHAISAKRSRDLQVRKWRLIVVSPLADIAVIFIADAILRAIFHPTGNPMTGHAVYIIWIGIICIMSIAITGEIDSFKKYSEFNADPNSLVRVQDDGVDYAIVKGTRVVPFTLERTYSLDYTYSLSMFDHVRTGSIRGRDARYRIGPVDDLFDMYYDIMKNYHHWLAGKEYFMNIGDIRQVFIHDQPIMARIAHVVAAGAGLESSIPANAVAIEQLKARLAKVKSADLAPAPLDAVREQLIRPMEQYLDALEPKEHVLHVHHPSRPRASPDEVLLAQKGMIIVQKASVKKIGYDAIESVKFASHAFGELDTTALVFQLKDNAIPGTVPFSRTSSLPVTSPAVVRIEGIDLSSPFLEVIKAASRVRIEI